MGLEDDPQLVKVLSALAATGDVAYVWDLASDGVEWHGSPDMLGLPDAAAVSTARGFARSINPDDFLLRQRRLDAHLLNGGIFDVEYRIRREDGSHAWLHERGSVERDEFGRPQRMLGVVRAVHDEGMREPPSAAPAARDEAVGLVNRKRLRGTLDRLLMQSLCSGGAGAFLAIGIDNFSALENALGSDAAETLAIAIGKRLNGCLGPDDEVGRVSPDRFGVVVANCGEERIAVVAEAMIESVRRTPIATAAGVVRATISIGGAVFPEQAPSPPGVMALAGIALADAQSEGEARFALYSPTEEQRRHRTVALELGERVRRALRDDGLRFAYQPIVESETGTVDYYESLLRMISQDGSIVIAGSFVETIEQLGFIRQLDRHVLEMIVGEVMQSPGIRLGLNISGLTASDPTWLDAATALLRGKPEIAERLVVEITETAALHDLDESARFVRRLKDLGCRVAFDDFGVGFTSLRHLHALAIDLLKIDGSAIRDIVHDAGSQSFLRHLVGLAKGLNVRAVAEYVETKEQAEVLRREGVALLQGYYFGAPSLDRPWLSRPDAAEPRCGSRPTRPSAPQSLRVLLS